MENILFRLKDFFDPFFKSRLEEWKRLDRYMYIEKMKAKTLVKSAGEKEFFFRFILEGAAAMQVKIGKREVCFDLCFENNILTDFESLNRDKPTDIQILTFEPIRLILINRRDLFRIYQASEFGSKLRRALAEQQIQRNHKNNIGYLGKTTAERYEKLMQERQQWLRRTPQHLIASFLGVSPENLSRVRRNLGRKPGSG